MIESDRFGWKMKATRRFIPTRIGTVRRRDHLAILVKLVDNEVRCAMPASEIEHEVFDCRAGATEQHSFHLVNGFVTLERS